MTETTVEGERIKEEEEEEEKREASATCLLADNLSNAPCASEAVE